MDWTLKTVDDIKVYHTKHEANLYDTFVLFSDGVVHAGIGETLNFGWDIPQIKDFLQGLYKYHISNIISILSLCKQIYLPFHTYFSFSISFFISSGSSALKESSFSVLGDLKSRP